ncbi:MAG TPA: hypothetical protein VFC51_10460 [Chloroflexota bacterium]|nr:hypothetical protein [Chloroflexota bacterium]
MVRLADLHQNIRQAIEVADVRRSRRLCTSILTARPDNLETLMLLAEVDLESGDHHAAVDGFHRVLEGDPEAYLAYAGLAIASEELRDPGAAVHYFSRALDLKPANAEIRRERDRLCESEYPGRPIPPLLNPFATARSFLEAGFYHEAADAHRLALQQEPGRLETKLGLAESLWMLGGTQEPQDICADVLAEAPRSVKASALIACVTAEVGDVATGRTMLEPMHDQDPDGRIAGYLVAQTPLAPWATVPVDLAIEQDLSEAEEAAHGVAAPAWAHWMRHALWQVLRLVAAPVQEGPNWAILEAVDPDIRRRTTPFGPLGRRVRAVDQQAGLATTHTAPPTSTPSATSATPDDDGTRAQTDDDATEIILRPWPIPRPRHKKGD